MPVLNRIDGHIHAESRVVVFFGDVKFHLPVAQKFHLPVVAIDGVGVRQAVFFVLNLVQSKNRFVKICQPRHVFGAKVHVVILEFHI
jgi:hypothetical protein